MHLKAIVSYFCLKVSSLS